MSYSIINLTAKVVSEELDNIIVDYSQYPYLVFLSLPFVRQKIIANVLNRISNRYALVENQQEKQIFDNFQPRVLEERLLIEYLINKIVLNLSTIKSNSLEKGHKYLSQIIYEYIEKDPENIFKQQYLNNRPDVDFRMLALARISGKPWQEISLQLGISISELGSFYQSCCQIFAANF